MTPFKQIGKAVRFGCVVAMVTYGASQTFGYRPILFLQNRLDDCIMTACNSSCHTAVNESSKIVIVDIDDRSMAELGDFNYFPRRFFGKVISKLKVDGARLIFLDVFLKEGGEYNDNVSLADSLKSAGNVCCGFYMSLDHESRKKHPGGTVLNEYYDFAGLKPIEKVEFLKSNQIAFSFHELIMSADSVGVGFANYVPDSDGILRHIPLFMAHRRLLFPSASLQMWLYTHGFYCSDGEITSHGVRFGTTFIPTDRYCYMRVNYQSNDGGYPCVSFVDVLDNRYSKGIFNGRIIMVGSSSKKLNDLKRIPGNRLIPGVEVHAAALSTILSKRFITPAPGLVTLVMTLAAGIITEIVLSLFHPVRVGVPFILCFSSVLLGSAYLNYMYRLQFINTIIPASVIFILLYISLFRFLSSDS